MKMAELAARINNEYVCQFIESIVNEMVRRGPRGANIHRYNTVVCILRNEVKLFVEPDYPNVKFSAWKKRNSGSYEVLLSRLHRANTEFDIKM